jgi:acyl carrier protein
VDTLLQYQPAARGDLKDDLPLGAGGLGVSSLLLLQVFVRLEEQLGFVFDDAEVANAKFTTIGELVGFVEGALLRQQLARAIPAARPSTGSG